MRQGLFPGQQQMLVEYARIGIEAESGFRRTRRRFLLALGLAVPLAAGSGFAVARWLERRDRARPLDAADARVLERLAWARRLAEGPATALLAASTTFLMVLDRCGGDPVLWRGFERLAELVEASADDSRRSLAARLLISTEAQELPAELQAWPARLRQRVK